MYLIVLLLFLELLSQIQCGCPIRCNCTENSINCVSKKLETVPYFENVSNNPIIIDLSGNSISIVDIDDFSFDKSDQVKEIYLNGSEVGVIEEKAFNELTNLQELYLADNVLNSLPHEFITSNENMILLDISRNYFIDFPKINSPSLEVLAIANSGVTRVANDVLNGLPNLRVLLLQQNSLKYVNPVIFDKMSNFFFVRMAFNPWQCNCKTVTLFSYLTVKKIADITEPVQCQMENKTFIDIYDTKGVTKMFQEQCKDNDVLESSEDYLFEEDDYYEVETENPTSDVTYVKEHVRDEVQIDHFYYTNYYYSSLLCISITISLIMGAVFGSCMTYKFLRGNIRQTESWNKLLSKSHEDYA